MSLKQLPAFSVGVFLSLVPSIASACPMCFDPTDENRLAFILTTAVLTVTPLIIIVSFIVWLRKRLQTLKAEETQHLSSHIHDVTPMTAPEEVNPLMPIPPNRNWYQISPNRTFNFGLRHLLTST